MKASEDAVCALNLARAAPTISACLRGPAEDGTVTSTNTRVSRHPTREVFAVVLGDRSHGRHAGAEHPSSTALAGSLARRQVVRVRGLIVDSIPLHSRTGRSKACRREPP
jgi:hypothetical protein